jgi:coenzyme PQQ synthesis protein D (PqqD)
LDPGTLIQRNDRAVFRQMSDGGAVVLHLDSAAYHGLNKVGTLIWDLVAPGISFGDLIRQLRGRLDNAPQTMEEEVAQFLDELNQRDLVTFSPPTS